MKMTKLAAVAAGLIVAASLAFTSCDGLGKDDFFGTWYSNYTVTNDNVAKGSGDGTQADKSAFVGSTVDITMYFDGTSEKLIDADQNFYQYKLRHDEDGELAARTFWLGTYDLKDNSNFTKGTLILTYRLGFDNVTEDQADALGKAWLCSTAADAYAAVKDFYEVDEPAAEQEVIDFLSSFATHTETATSDIEKFDFELGGQDFIKGYTTMKATAQDNCSWEVTSRSFTLQGTSNLLSEILDKVNGNGDSAGASE
jgi:hypothetical protein